MTDPRIQAIRDNAEKKVREMEREIFIRENLACPIAPRLVTIFTDHPWVSFSPASWSEALTIVNTFRPYLVPTVDYSGSCRELRCKATWKDKPGYEFMGEYDCAIELNARCVDYMSASQTASVWFYVNHPSCGSLLICLDFDTAYYAKTPYPSKWHCRFYKVGEGRHRREWRSEPAQFGSDGFISYGTGAPRGQARHDVYLFLNIETVVSMFENFAAVAATLDKGE